MVNYAEYIKSRQWEATAALCRKERHYKCEVCGGTGIDVHHKTYAHLGDELNHPEDLQLLCKECHKTIHGIPTNSLSTIKDKTRPFWRPEIYTITDFYGFHKCDSDEHDRCYIYVPHKFNSQIFVRSTHPQLEVIYYHTYDFDILRDKYPGNCGPGTNGNWSCEGYYGSGGGELGGGKTLKEFRNFLNCRELFTLSVRRRMPGEDLTAG